MDCPITILFVYLLVVFILFPK